MKIKLGKIEGGIIMEEKDEVLIDCDNCFHLKCGRCKKLFIYGTPSKFFNYCPNCGKLIISDNYEGKEYED